MADDPRIREARDDDAEGLISLIASVFTEYEGCVVDLDELDRDLLAIRSFVAARGGSFWVAEREGRIVGSAGYTQPNPGMVELKRLYIAKAERNRGLGRRFYGLVFEAARRLGARTLECWSDTRFKDAHAFYERRGFTQLPETRALNDPSHSIEYHFSKPL